MSAAAPLRAELREGWREILGSFVGLALAAGTVMTYTAGVFMSAIGEDFGWTGLDLAWPMMFFYYSLVPGSLICGLLIDRLGSRRIILVSTALLALGLAGLAALPRSQMIFCLAFGALGLCSIGTLPISYARVITGRFERRRGLALGIVLTGVGIGGAILPLLAQWLIDLSGWRVAYLALGLAVALLSLPIAWAFIRVAPDTQHECQRIPVDPVAAFREKPLVLAQLGAVSILSGAVLTGLVVNVVPIARSQGLDPATVALAAAALGLSIIVGRLAIGMLMDRYQASLVLGLFLIGPMFGALGLGFGESTSVFLLSVVLIGLAQGAEIDAIAFLVSRHFSRPHFGTVYGAMFALFTAGAANGPLFLAKMHALTGSFNGALVPVAVFAGLNCLIALTLPRYTTLPKAQVQ